MDAGTRRERKTQMTTYTVRVGGVVLGTQTSARPLTHAVVFAPGCAVGRSPGGCSSGEM
jgi:hypothetical protein